uniref:N-acetyl-D-glucosamine kinase n=1 Tax=Plectus sambesii TaxID=2011161 RepID=A0A914WEN1_9BILA
MGDEAASAAGYAMHLWPCSPFLAQYICNKRDLFKNASVLELGAGGTGLPGITAMKLGAKRVVFTDKEGHDQAMALCRKNCIENGIVAPEVHGLTWGDANGALSIAARFGPFDWVLASDCFYDPVVFEPLMSTIATLIAANSSTKVLFGYQERHCHWSIEVLIRRFGLMCQHVDPDSFHAECVAVAGFDDELRSHTVHLGIISADEHRKMSVFGGIEGGATNSKLVLLDGSGRVLSRTEWTGTNGYLLGLEKAAHEIAQLVNKGKVEAGLSVDVPLTALGLALAGAEDEDLNRQMTELLKSLYPNLAKCYHLTSDSVGTIATSLKDGGVVLIAGTGSACRLLNPDGTLHGCGGWGHSIGDEGSGYWISNKAIRYVYDEEDGLFRAPADTAFVKKAIFDYFSIESKTQLLDFLYAKFNKAHVAGLCKVLAEGAAHDELCKRVFKEAGHVLGLHVLAVAKHADAAMLRNIPVVTVGSVFKSWDLIKEGFLEGLRPRDSRDAVIEGVSLFHLSESPNIGAALLAAKEANESIPIDFSHNAQLFFETKLH